MATFGIVGCGNITSLTWAPHLAQDPLVDHVIYHDIDHTRAQALAGQHGGRAYARLDELLAQRPDGVVVATSPAAHARVALDALASGAHVIVEKPFAMQLSEAEDVIDAAQARSLTVYVPFIQLLTAADALAEVRAGLIGTVQTIECRFRQRAPGVRAIDDQGSHAIAFALACLGWAPATRVWALSVGETDILVFTAGDAIVTARLECGAPIAEAASLSARVTGSAGELLIPLRTTQTPPDADCRPRLITSASTQPRYLAEVMPVEVARAEQVSTWVRSLAAGTPLPGSGANACLVQSVEDAARKSAGLGGAVVVPTPPRPVGAELTTQG
jgi:predicted dehydrogenase